MKVLLIIVLCLVFAGCSKKTEKSEEQKSSKDTAIIQHREAMDTTKTSLLTKKDVLKKQEIDKDTVNAENLLSYEQRQGKYIFVKYCAVCHGELGKGNGFNTYNLNPKPKNFADSNYIAAYTDERLAESIIKGGRGVNKSPMMPSWGGTLNKDDLIYVVKYVSFLIKQKN
jgi:mono/diheme cytochrome c family protein